MICLVVTMKILIVLICVFHRTSGVIYTLNDTEYDRLPPLFRLDPFYPCLRSPGDLYCYVDAKLTANGSSELLHVLEEYSANTITHYNHTVIHWGICVKKTCHQYLNNDTDLDNSIEACLNSSLQETHQLQTRLVKDKVFCTKFGETVMVDTGDMVVATVIATILLLNVLGTLYDFCWTSRKSLVGGFLLCFSLKINWMRLIAPSGDGPEPRLERLKMFNGIKSLTTFLVVMGHSPLAALIISNNPDFIESTYHDIVFHIFYNGNLIVQSFFMMSGFLLAFNLLIIEEKFKLKWSNFPNFVMLRWLRLTPPYAVVLAIVATWMRHFGNGPLWKPTVGVAVEACRQDWYYHLLYLNDYVDHSQCMSHTWYVAADMQLTMLGLLIFCLLKSEMARKVAIGVSFVVGVVTPPAHVYFQNLHPKLMVAPEVARHYFVEDPTFNNLYKRMHTNMVCYAMGLGMGILIYNMMKNKFDINKYKKYRFIFWATFPAGILLILLGGIFFIDGLHAPTAVRIIYPAAIKIIFGMVGVVLLVGTVFKIENVYRGLLEWNGWAVLGRVSYCAYLVHEIIIRFSAANHTSLIHSNFFQILLTYFGLLVTTFVVAFPCWILIEAPFNQVVRLLFYPAPKDEAPETNSNGKVLAVQLISRKEFDVYGEFKSKNLPL